LQYLLVFGYHFVCFQADTSFFIRHYFFWM